MRGVIFTEFMDFTEAACGSDGLEDVIDAADLPHGGAYTAVGTYPFTEMQRLVVALSRRSGTPPGDLLRAFGDHLCRGLALRYPEFFRREIDLFDFIESVDRHIHVEVHKLYADAELPRFSTRWRDPCRLVIDYASCRPLEALAEGMIMAAAAHYGESVRVERSRAPGAGGEVRFTISRAA